jgi:hypothetical protein
MPPRGISGKRKRQYQHIKESERESGRSDDVASEIAGRTVNKQRASSGEARETTPGRRRPLATERKGAGRKSTGRKTAGTSRTRSTAAKRTSGGGSRKKTASTSRSRKGATKRTGGSASERSSRGRTKSAGRKK